MFLQISHFLPYFYTMSKHQPYIGREDDFQTSLVTYLCTKYPKALFMHPPNGGSRNLYEARKLQGMGVMPGFPDLMIFKVRQSAAGGSTSCGLALELKVGKNKPTEHQERVLKGLEAQGWQCHVTWSLDEAMEILDNYLS